MSTPEGKVKDAIKKIFKKWRVFYYMPVQNGMGTVGIPDFIACVQGKFIAVEAKAPGKGGNVTANQQRVIDAINESGGIAIVLDDALILDAVIRSLVYNAPNGGDNLDETNRKTPRITTKELCEVVDEINANS